jgi:antitoxin YefM
MAITASEARARLFPLIEQVNENEKPVHITSKGGNAVLISESEYESILETAYLLSSPANREHLFESMAQAQRGETYELTLPITAESLAAARKVGFVKRARKKPARVKATSSKSKRSANQTA